VQTYYVAVRLTVQH